MFNYFVWVPIKWPARLQPELIIKKLRLPFKNINLLHIPLNLVFTMPKGKYEEANFNFNEISFKLIYSFRNHFTQHTVTVFAIGFETQYNTK